jgi:hypothetical protein
LRTSALRTRFQLMPTMTRSRKMLICEARWTQLSAQSATMRRNIKKDTGMASPKTSELRPAVAAAAATCDMERCMQASADIGGSVLGRPSRRSWRLQREAAECISWIAGENVAANLKGKKAQVKDRTIDSRTIQEPASAGLKVRQFGGGGRICGLHLKPQALTADHKQATACGIVEMVQTRWSPAF